MTAATSSLTTRPAWKASAKRTTGKFAMCTSARYFQTTRFAALA